MALNTSVNSIFYTAQRNDSHQDLLDIGSVCTTNYATASKELLDRLTRYWTSSESLLLIRFMEVQRHHQSRNSTTQLIFSSSLQILLFCWKSPRTNQICYKWIKYILKLNLVYIHVVSADIRVHSLTLEPVWCLYMLIFSWQFSL